MYKPPSFGFTLYSKTDEPLDVAFDAIAADLNDHETVGVGRPVASHRSVLVVPIPSRRGDDDVELIRGGSRK